MWEKVFSYLCRECVYKMHVLFAMATMLCAGSGKTHLPSCPLSWQWLSIFLRPLGILYYYNVDETFCKVKICLSIYVRGHSCTSLQTSQLWGGHFYNWNVTTVTVVFFNSIYLITRTITLCVYFFPHVMRMSKIMLKFNRQSHRCVLQNVHICVHASRLFSTL